MLSPRTAKYVEALIREGDSFSPHEWVSKTLRQEAELKRRQALFASGEISRLELADENSVSTASNTQITSRPALPLRRSINGSGECRTAQKAKNENPDTRLRRRLSKVCDAFDDFQEGRARDAVYGYLEEVYGLVVHYKVRRKTNRLLRRAFKFAGLPFDKKADPFAVVFRCTSENALDSKTISKWARVLRYVGHCKVPRMQMKAFMKELGGINACADRYAKYIGRGRR
jgi:hypothetical protein